MLLNPEHALILADGRKATILPRSANDLFTYSEKAQKLGLSAANQWMTIKYLTVNDTAITPETLDSVLKLRAKTKVYAALLTVEGSPTPIDGGDFLDSEIFALPDHRVVTVLDPPGGILDRYLEMVTKSYSKALVLIFKNLFEVEGQKITDEFLADLYPSGLGYEAATFLLAYWSNFFQDSQPL